MVDGMNAEQTRSHTCVTSSGKSVQPTVPGMITMELPHIQPISETISQPIFINDPPN